MSSFEKGFTRTLIISGEDKVFNTTIQGNYGYDNGTAIFNDLQASYYEVELVNWVLPQTDANDVAVDSLNVYISNWSQPFTYNTSTRGTGSLVGVIPNTRDFTATNGGSGYGVGFVNNGCKQPKIIIEKPTQEAFTVTFTNSINGIIPNTANIPSNLPQKYTLLFNITPIYLITDSDRFYHDVRGAEVLPSRHFMQKKK